MQIGSLVMGPQDISTCFAISMDDTSRPPNLLALETGAEPVHLFSMKDQRFYLQVTASSSEQSAAVASSSKNTSGSAWCCPPTSRPATGA